MIPITHYRWSPKRSLWIVAILCTVLAGIPCQITSGSMLHRPVNRADLHKIIAKNHTNPNLVASIIQTESNWNVNAVSPKGAIGLMQVMPTSAGLSREELFCPERNIIAGCRLLKYYQRTSPDLRTALHRYSGGASGYFEKVMRQLT
jgi:soluble lytic murein transglycosylase-like protein